MLHYTYYVNSDDNNPFISFVNKYFYRTIKCLHILIKINLTFSMSKGTKKSPTETFYQSPYAGRFSTNVAEQLLVV